MKRYLLLVMALVLCLAGCTAQGGDATDGGGSDEQPSAASTDSADGSSTDLADDTTGDSSDEGDEPDGILTSVDDVSLQPTDDYGYGYVFSYDGEEFVATYDGDSWRVYDSYRITSIDDIELICQALISEHPVLGADWVSYRTAEDMAFEWGQHNFAYEMLPEDSEWLESVKDVDLDPDDQDKTFKEMYEDRTGKSFSGSDIL